MRKTLLIFISVLLSALAVTSCSKTEPAERPSATISKKYELRGTVISVNREDKEAIIEHEAIEGFMEAMRMGFAVPEAADLDKLHPGDRIKATLAVENSMTWIENVEVLGSGPIPENPSKEPPAHNHP